jgi:hypothetical protein
MILFDMNNPNPVPFSDFVANFVNNLGIISEAIPIPVSFILTITLWSSSLFSSKLSDIVPSLVNLTALFNKFQIT